MIDTHTHLYFNDFKEEIEEMISRCEKAGVSHFILPNIDLESISSMKELNNRFPDITSMAIGLHPTEVNEDWEKVLDTIISESKSGFYKAIGEIGLDLYWDQSKLDIQEKAFESQLRLAYELNLPVIIHSRSAFPQTIEIINKVKPEVELIFHSFTGSKNDVRSIREVCDPFFGINGVVTYKNAPELRDALHAIGINRIVLETDSPFLSPVPMRGKRNESSYLPYIRDKVAETLEMSPEQVEKTTDQNAISIFGI